MVVQLSPLRRSSDGEAIERLLQSGDLVRLTARVSQFNLFEAIGMVRQEVRHSYLLAHLLDPRQTHRLGDAFLRRFLGFFHDAIVATDAAGAITLERVTVQREWEFVDLLVEVPSHRLVLLIENKVDSAEHSDQLNRVYIGERHPTGSLAPVLSARSISKGAGECTNLLESVLWKAIGRRDSSPTGEPRYAFPLTPSPHWLQGRDRAEP